MYFLSRFVSFLSALLVLGLSAGCGVTGGTSARKIALNPALKVAPLAKPVRVGTVTSRPGAGVNRAIGAYNLGRFDDSDVATLRETLLRSLPPAAAANAPTVHVVAQHFGLTFTNNRVAGLVIIDWCLADGTKVMTSERFYAAYDSGNQLFGTETLGMAKNRILHAAAARIAECSLASANALPVPPSPALTFDDPLSATSTLPDRMEAAGAQGLVGTAVQQTMLGGLEGATLLLPEQLPPPVDWNTHIQRYATP